MTNQFIYEVKAVSLTERTKDDIQKELDSVNARYGHNMDMKRFMEHLRAIYRDKYEASSFTSSFHFNQDEAVKYATGNIGDINESGCYNYAAVCRNMVGKAYFDSCQDPDNDFWLFKYDRDTGHYLPLPKEASEYMYVLVEAWGYCPARPSP